MTNKLIIYSIPKCGTHFISQIVALLINPECNIYDKNELYKSVKHLTKKEFLNKEKLDISFFSTHPVYLNYDQVAKFPHKKLFVIRNPLDQIISNFFFKIYYRISSLEMDGMKKNLNENIYNFCLENIEKTGNQIIKHIDNSKIMNGSILVDYSYVFDNKYKFIRKMAEIMDVTASEELVNFINDKTDIQKCSEYEREHNSFKVGAIQNGPFFRQGGNQNCKKYLNPDQIKRLKRHSDRSCRELPG